jgi:glycosyltransferase involved in cell wall biosynthesis
MLVTVAICTWNRASLLDRTLNEMRDLAVPKGIDWEVLVVNNCCTDDTEEVLERRRSQLPLRKVFESRQGQCNARNTAVSHAGGDLIVWTDDDVLVDSGWLAAYCHAAGRWPDADYFGGPIAPWYESPPPLWIEENVDLLKGMLVVRDLGPMEDFFAEDDAPFGANMAFRRRIFGNMRFDARLGLVANSSIRGDETALILALRKQGRRGVWVPGAKVRHFVPAARMTRAYLWDWAYGYGRTTVRVAAQQAARPPQKPSWRMCANRYRHGLRYWVRRALRRRSWASSYYHLAADTGIIDELRSQWNASR